MSQIRKSGEPAVGGREPGDGRSARERLRAKRAAQERARRVRRRVGIAAAAVVAVVAGVVAAVALAAGTGGPGAGGPLVVPANASGPDGTVIVYGNPAAKHTLEVWEDFRCPFCDKLEKADGPVMQQLADDGTYKIRYHLAAFLDQRLGGHGSIDALAAAGAALDQGTARFKAFHDLLYANQPPEESDGFGDRAVLERLAGRVPGLSMTAFTKALEERTYAPWAAKVAAAFTSSGVQGTPALTLDGHTLTVFDSAGNPLPPARFTAQVQQALAGH
jgi:protein-disulfide isomerase